VDRGVSAALAAPVRLAAAVGGAITSGGRAIFRSTRSAWQFVYSRTRFDYRSEIGDPLDNSIIAALMAWIARNFPEAPVRIQRVGADGKLTPVPPATTGPGFMLRLLERPNKYYAGPVQWAATIVDYLLGNAYWAKVRNTSGRVVELWWLPAWMVEPRWNENDPASFIEYYEYRVDTQIYTLAVDDVVHFRNGIDPKNVRKGLSRLGSLFREIFTDNEAANMTASLMRNLGVPGLIIAPANTNQGPLRFDAEGVKKKANETFGGDGVGGTMVLTRPTEVKVLSWSPEQMNLRELRRIPEERASAVIGIPAIVANLGAGLDHSTFTNAGEANVSAYTQGVIPLQRNIAAELELQLLDEFANLEDGYDVDFDWTQVKAMAAFVDALYKRATDALRAGALTRAEWKRDLGRAVAANGDDDVYVIANNFMFVPARGNQPAGGGTSRPAAASADGPFHLIEANLEIATAGVPS
jgi:HK97 family phage portal protein